MIHILVGCVVKLYSTSLATTTAGFYVFPCVPYCYPIGRPGVFEDGVFRKRQLALAPGKEK